MNFDKRRSELSPANHSPVQERRRDKVPDQKTHEEKIPWQKSLVLYLHDCVYLVGLMIVALLLVFRVVVVSGTSMNGTLLDGDYLLLIGNTFYREPKYGDIIVASKDSFKDGEPIIKRVIATEGQTVDIDFKRGIVYVDGIALDEPYTLTATNLNEGIQFPLTVDEGCIFVLGDNRNGSRDSRYPEIGLIDKREVLGKAIFLWLPGTNGTDAEGNALVSRDWSRIGVVK
ncbi:MAG: signal peptidase I [Faecousia sp.]